MARHDHTLPMDSNPLAKAVGSRLRLVIDERGISDKQAAKQMGVHHVRLGYLLRGAQVPTERATRAAKRLGLGLSSIVSLAVERLLDHEPVMATFEEASRRLNKARVTQYLEGDPHLQVILEGDINIAVQMGGQLAPARGRPPVMHTHPLLEDPTPDLGESEWEIIE